MTYTVTFTDSQQERFEKMLLEGLSEIEAHKNGTKQFKTLDQVLSELNYKKIKYY